MGFDGCLEAIMAAGKSGQSYLIGGDMELTNLELVARIHKVFISRRPNQTKEFEDIFEFVTDRLGHDRRYAIDTSQLKSQFPEVLGVDFDKALNETLDFYLENDD